MKKVAYISRLLLILPALSVLDCRTLSAPHLNNVSAQAPEVGSVIVIVRAKDAVQSPLPNGEVTVNQRGKLIKNANWDAVDYYVARGLLPGKYKVTANVPGYKSVSKDNVTVKKQETVRVEIDLSAAPPARRPR